MGRYWEQILRAEYCLLRAQFGTQPCTLASVYVLNSGLVPFIEGSLERLHQFAEGMLIYFWDFWRAENLGLTIIYTNQTGLNTRDYRGMQLTHFLQSLPDASIVDRPFTDREEECEGTGPIWHAISRLYVTVLTDNSADWPPFWGK